MSAAFRAEKHAHSPKKSCRERSCSLHPHGTYTWVESPKIPLSILSLPIACIAPQFSQQTIFAYTNCLLTNAHGQNIAKSPSCNLCPIFLLKWVIFSYLIFFLSTEATMCNHICMCITTNILCTFFFNRAGFHHCFAQSDICKLESRKLLRKDSLISTKEKAICPF